MNSPVFRSRTGKPLDRSRVLRIVKDAADKVDVNPSVTTQWLRHAHASHALDNGAPIHLVRASWGAPAVARSLPPGCALILCKRFETVPKRE